MAWQDSWEQKLSYWRVKIHITNSFTRQTMHTLRSVAWPRPPAVRLCALGISGREGVALRVIGVMGRGQMLWPREEGTTFNAISLATVRPLTSNLAQNTWPSLQTVPGTIWLSAKIKLGQANGGLSGRQYSGSLGNKEQLKTKEGNDQWQRRNNVGVMCCGLEHDVAPQWQAWPTPRRKTSRNVDWLHHVGRGESDRTQALNLCNTMKEGVPGCPLMVPHWPAGRTEAYFDCLCVTHLPCQGRLDIEKGKGTRSTKWFDFALKVRNLKDIFIHVVPKNSLTMAALLKKVSFPKRNNHFHQWFFLLDHRLL